MAKCGRKRVDFGEGKLVPTRVIAKALRVSVRTVERDLALALRKLRRDHPDYLTMLDWIRTMQAAQMSAQGIPTWRCGSVECIASFRNYFGE